MNQVADGVFRLGSRAHNFYIVKDGKSATIIDAGCSKDWVGLVDALGSLGMTFDSVEGLIITHAHSDHFGSAKQLSGEGVEVSVHEEEETRATGKYRGRFAVSAHELPLYSMSTWRNFLPIMRAGVMKLDFLDQVDTFGDNDVLDLPGRPRVVHTPGHTEGHSMFHLPNRGLVFTGDALATMDLLGNATGPQMLDERFHLDDEQAHDSLSRLRGLSAEMLLPGHGEPWTGSPEEALALVAVAGS